MPRAVDVIRRVAPRARPAYIEALDEGDALLLAHGITTPARLAHFLAQVLHESGAFEIEWENMSYGARRLLEVFGAGRHSAGVTSGEAQALAHRPEAIAERVYGLGNPRKARALGNTQPGDGFRYRGGGLLQTTGRANYRRMGQKCGVDFEAQPDLVLSAEHALKPALCEWTEGRLNAFEGRNARARERRNARRAYRNDQSSAWGAVGSIQAGAGLAPGVSQQAFKHVTGIWVAGVIAAHVTPTSEIPIDGAGFGDQLRKGRRLAGRPVRVKRARQIAPRSRLRHCRYKVGVCRSIAGTL
jgi:predicted chitinase